MAHAYKPDFIFRRNGRAHLNRRRRKFSRLWAAEVCASAVVMLDTPCSKVVRRVLATHNIRQFPLHFPSRASSCAITFQLESATRYLETRENHIHKAQRGQPMPPADIRTKNLQNTRSECHRCTNLFGTSKRGQPRSYSKLGSVPSTVCYSHRVETY